MGSVAGIQAQILGIFGQADQIWSYIDRLYGLLDSHKFKWLKSRLKSFFLGPLKLIFRLEIWFLTAEIKVKILRFLAKQDRVGLKSHWQGLKGQPWGLIARISGQIWWISGQMWRISGQWRLESRVARIKSEMIRFGVKNFRFESISVRFQAKET